VGHGGSERHFVTARARQHQKFDDSAMIIVSACVPNFDKFGVVEHAITKVIYYRVNHTSPAPLTSSRRPFQAARPPNSPPRRKAALRVSPQDRSRPRPDRPYGNLRRIADGIDPGATRRQASRAVEYASRRVRVNAVSPGAIKTPMNSPEAHDFLSGLQPMGRMGEMHEIADAVMYLEKSAFVTGEILHVDGGWSAGRG
jgi:Enoyl-(Acyl carrier protein) reductase